MGKEIDFAQLRKAYADFDRAREEVLKKNRDVVKLSKQIIYSIHRGDYEKADALCATAKNELAALVALTKKHPALYYSAAIRAAEQEYVEAVCYYAFATGRALPSAEILEVDTDSYLLGLCDLAGELVRRAINAAMKEQYAEAVKIKDTVAHLYEEFMLFDFRNSELRRKFDGMKYDLKKLEELALELKLRGKIAK